MRFDGIIFDLDGTLWDATVATAQAWNQILREEQLDVPLVTPQNVADVTGLPHDEAVRQGFPSLRGEALDMMIQRTQAEDSTAIERFGAPRYAGVEAGLRQLAAQVPLFIVSNCQEGYIETFFAVSALGHLFRDTECFGRTGRPKGDNLASVIKRNALRSAIMVGDTRGDEMAARQCGIPFAFVTYGFGNAESPDASFATFGDLTAWLLDPA